MLASGPALGDDRAREGAPEPVSKTKPVCTFARCKPPAASRRTLLRAAFPSHLPRPAHSPPLCMSRRCSPAPQHAPTSSSYGSVDEKNGILSAAGSGERQAALFQAPRKCTEHGQRRVSLCASRGCRGGNAALGGMGGRQGEDVSSQGKGCGRVQGGVRLHCGWCEVPRAGASSAPAQKRSSGPQATAAQLSGTEHGRHTAPPAATNHRRRMPSVTHHHFPRSQV